MSRLPNATGRQVISALERAGFHVARVEGSHHHLTKPGHLWVVTVPVHAGRDIPSGTLRNILRQAGLTPEEFARLL